MVIAGPARPHPTASGRTNLTATLAFDEPGGGGADDAPIGVPARDLSGVRALAARSAAAAASRPAQAAPTDAALIAAHRRGDQRAFEQLFDRYADRLGGMCWKYLHDRALVDDLVQETFSRLVVNIDRIEGTLNVAAWLHRIAVNLCLDEVRRRAIRRSDVAIDAGHDLGAMASLPDVAGWTIPERAFEIASNRAMVREAISRLPLRQRHVLILREVREMGYREMADHLKVPIGAVHGLLHRAREGFALRYMELDGAAAPLTPCAQVTYLRETVGRARLRADRRRSVATHLVTCERCAEVA
jgi:RNA polymerase sigma-70 factor (ECF subfamily)